MENRFEKIHFLGNYKTLWDSEGNLIEWRYFESLAKLHESTGLRIGGAKLSNRHIEFDKNVMNVEVAAQTLSNSTAEAFLFLAEYEEFQNCEHTAKYCKMVKNAFGILNSDESTTNDENVYKRPLNKAAIDPIRKFVEEFEDFVCNIFTTSKRSKATFVRVIESEMKTAFIGLLSALKNMVALCDEGITGKLFTFRLSQDLLEQLFGLIRGGPLGYNTNPTCVQFEAAVKKLLFKNEVDLSEHANIQKNNIPMLVVSSKCKKKSEATESAQLTVGETIQSSTIQPSSQQPWPQLSQPSEQLKQIKEQMLPFYAAGTESAVSKKLRDCEICKLVFESHEHTHDKLVEKVNLKQPCLDTIHIIKIAENFACATITKSDQFGAIVAKILSQLQINELYLYCNHHDHKIKVIKNIIQVYLESRFRELSRQISQNLKKKKQKPIQHLMGQ